MREMWAVDLGAKFGKRLSHDGKYQFATRTSPLPGKSRENGGVVRGFVQQHPIWFGCWTVTPAGAVGVAVGAVGSAEGLPIWQWLLLGGAGALAGFLVAVFLLWIGLRLWAWPGNRRRRTVTRIQQRIRDLGVRESLTPVVQRARHAAGQGELPAGAEPWRRNDIEASEMSQAVLQPLRTVLIEEGQPHLAAVVFGPPGTVDGSPADFARDADRLLGMVENWSAADGSAEVFKVGRFGGT